MNFRLKTLVIILIVAFATMAPVCVLSGGESTTTTSTITLAPGALIEVIGEYAEVRVHRVSSNTLDLKATFHNGEFVDFYSQNLTLEPSNHFVISAKTGGSGSKSANSIIELGIPAGMQLYVRTTNRPISIDSASLTTASLTTTDGKISVTNSSGDYDLSTTNSEVIVQSVDGNVNITTTNAHVWFDGMIDAGGNSISTTNGDVAVRLRNGSDVTVSGETHNGEVTVNGGSDGVAKDGDTATLEHRIENGAATLNITNGPGAIHINPETIAVFDGDS
ncbi:MAG: DUF4097 family beta strand repeat protein [Chloroflexi bacterium]|jgi:DUF4097 and DUF4098 domain-containing protein YvlB|nr:DUF4097 family beta strand repeat protein [Chloroflexota bacterium]